MSQQLDTTEMCPNVDPTSERTAQRGVCPQVKLTLSDSTACPSESGLIPQSKLELSQLAGEEDLSVLGTEKPCLLSTSQRSMKTLTPPQGDGGLFTYRCLLLQELVSFSHYCIPRD